MCAPKVLHEGQKYETQRELFSSLTGYLFRTYKYSPQRLISAVPIQIHHSGQEFKLSLSFTNTDYLDLSVFVYETGGQNFNFVKQSRKSICSVVIESTTCFNI